MTVFRPKQLAARAVRRFRKDEDGASTTIEFVLWLPIFVLILSLIVDVCFVFLRQAVMYDVASDTARRYAVGRFGATGSDPAQPTTETSAETYASAEATFASVAPTVVVNENIPQSVVTVNITHDLSTLDVTGVFSSIASYATATLQAEVVQIVETEGATILP